MARRAIPTLGTAAARAAVQRPRTPLLRGAPRGMETAAIPGCIQPVPSTPIHLCPPPYAPPVHLHLLSAAPVVLRRALPRARRRHRADRPRPDPRQRHRGRRHTVERHPCTRLRGQHRLLGRQSARQRRPRVAPAGRRQDPALSRWQHVRRLPLANQHWQQRPVRRLQRHFRRLHGRREPDRRASGHHRQLRHERRRQRRGRPRRGGRLGRLCQQHEEVWRQILGDRQRDLRQRRVRRPMGNGHAQRPFGPPPTARTSCNTPAP